MHKYTYLCINRFILIHVYSHICIHVHIRIATYISMCMYIAVPFVKIPMHVYLHISAAGNQDMFRVQMLRLRFRSMLFFVFILSAKELLSVSVECVFGV